MTKIRRSARCGSKGSTQTVGMIAYLIKENGFSSEDELLSNVFSGETESLRATSLGVSVWGCIHKSTVIHKSTKLGSYRITNCYVKDEELSTFTFNDYEA